MLSALCPARPHPRAALRRNRHLEDAADDDAVLQHVVVLLVVADWRALQDQRGHLSLPINGSTDRRAPPTVALKVIKSAGAHPALANEGCHSHAIVTPLPPPLGEPKRRHEADVTAITICLNWMAVVITFTVSSRVMSQCGRTRDWIGAFAGRRTRP